MLEAPESFLNSRMAGIERFLKQGVRRQPLLGVGGEGLGGGFDERVGFREHEGEHGEFRVGVR